MAVRSAVVGALTLAACVGFQPLSSVSTSAAAAPLTESGWYGYHGAGTSSGYSPLMPAAGALHLVSRRRLDGAVYGSPIVARGVVVAATENDTVYGLNTAGSVIWHQHVGSPSPASQRPCGDISPLGITGTPVYSTVTGAAYVVAETGTGGVKHTLIALDVLTGRVEWRRSVDFSGVDPVAMQQRGALRIAGGRVWVTFGGLAGDCGNYKGRLIGVPVNGQGAAVTYTVPTAREGGIWQPSGPIIDQAGHLLVAVGNGAAVAGDAYDDSDSVSQIDTQAHLQQLFAPSGWANENAGDVDLGSIGPALVGTSWLVQGGKSGRVYVLRQGSLGGIGGQVSSLTVSPSFGGTAVRNNIVYLPCVNGVHALSVDKAGNLHLLWSSRSTIIGAPVVGGNRVWSLAPSSGTLYSLNPSTGGVMASLGVGTTNRFATPALYRNVVIVPTLTGLSFVTE
ncbi:MAG: outer membrane protein assembly factor BamB family protein [Marmoricola sp.]